MWLKLAGQEFGCQLSVIFFPVTTLLLSCEVSNLVQELSSVVVVFAAQLYVDMGLVDASLTSCVAVCFVFNALVDGEVIRERSAGTLAMMIASFAGVFFLYFFTDVNKIL